MVIKSNKTTHNHNDLMENNYFTSAVLCGFPTQECKLLLNEESFFLSMS